MPTKKTFNRADLHADVTAQIVASLEAGVRPWVNERWTSADITRPLRSTGEPYQGINVLLLWAAALDAGFSSSHWMTYKQAQTLGGQVRKGSKSSRVVFAKTFTKKNDDGEDQLIPVLRSYRVFSVDQIDDLPEEFYQRADPVPEIERDVAADSFFASTGATIRHAGGQAFYSPTTDSITVPDPGTFSNMGAYYATVAHELIHWTRDRVGRPRGESGDKVAYGFEELVAELGAAYLCADLGVAPTVREDHASYLTGWLENLKEDNRAIFRASSLAQKAVAYLHEQHEHQGAKAA